MIKMCKSLSEISLLILPPPAISRRHLYPIIAMEGGEWKNGLFSGICGADNCGMCLGAWCCACFLHGRTAERLDDFPSEETPGLFNGACFLMYAAACCHLHWLPALFKRGDTRSKFGIRGDGCTDCLVSCARCLYDPRCFGMVLI